MTIKMKFVPQWTQDLKNKIDRLDQKPRLTIIHSNDDRPTKLYLKNKLNYGKQLGIEVDLVTPSKEYPLRKIMTDCSCNLSQMMLQQPARQDLTHVFVDALDKHASLLDVEGVTMHNQMALHRAAMNGKLSDDLIMPCTVAGDLKLLRHYLPDYDYTGKVVLMIGRSAITGTPAAEMFEALNCTVIKANSHTQNLKQLCELADIIVSCVGKPDLVTTCKPGAILIDNGISYVSGHCHGDIATQCYTNALAYTPYIGATGKATVHCLFENLVKNQRKMFA